MSSKIGRPLGSSTVRYTVKPEARRRLRWLATKLRGLARAVVVERILADEPKTLRQLAARYGLTKHAAARAETQALAVAGVRRRAV